MKKRIIYTLVSIIACAVFSIVIEIFVFNFNAIFNHHDSIQDISYSESSHKNTTTLHLDLDNQYVNKLIINYDASKDIHYSLHYSSPGLYGDTQEHSSSDILDDSFNKSITNINKNISEMSIEYEDPNSDDVKILSIDSDNNFHFNFARTLFVFLGSSLLCALFFFYKDGFKTEKIHIYFAVAGSILGTMIIVAQPSTTFYSYDDQIHFQNVVDLFGGNITYSTGEYNSTEANIANSPGRGSINSIEEQQSQDELNDSGLAPYSKTISRLPTYNKIAYIPMAIGYHLAKIFNLPFAVCFKIGKLFNLLSYILLLAYAIKTTKVGKRLLSIIALIPANIFLASEYSYDPAVFAGITIFIVHLVNLLLDKNSKLNFKTILIMIASISYACLTKAVYAPFLLLTLLIPKNRFENNRQAKLVKTGLSIITILLLATFILPAISGSMDGDPRGGNTSVSDQLSLILSHPLSFIQLLGDTTVAQFGAKLIGGFNRFAYIPNIADTSSSNFFYILIFTIFFIFITDNKNNQLTKNHRIMFLLTSAITIIFIWTALYLSFTPVGANNIEGVQSRYFFPLLFPILICLQSKNIQSKINPKLYNGITIIVPTIIILIMITSSILAVYSY